MQNPCLVLSCIVLQLPIPIPFIHPSISSAGVWDMSFVPLCSLFPLEQRNRGTEEMMEGHRFCCGYGYGNGWMGNNMTMRSNFSTSLPFQGELHKFLPKSSSSSSSSIYPRKKHKKLLFSIQKTNKSSQLHTHTHTHTHQPPKTFSPIPIPRCASYPKRTTGDASTPSTASSSPAAPTPPRACAARRKSTGTSTSRARSGSARCVPPARRGSGWRGPSGSSFKTVRFHSVECDQELGRCVPPCWEGFSSFGG